MSNGISTHPSVISVIIMDKTSMILFLQLMGRKTMEIIENDNYWNGSS
jgi:hypothetical protein